MMARTTPVIGRNGTHGGSRLPARNTYTVQLWALPRPLVQLSSYFGAVAAGGCVRDPPAYDPARRSPEHPHQKL